MAKSSPFSVRTASLMLLIAMMVLSLAPVTSASAQAAAVSGPRTGLLSQAALSFVTVTAPDINTLFDYDGIITVNDTADHFLPAGATGDAFLQTRLWPIGQDGLIGGGLYPYLYRIDLRNAVAAVGTAASCVSTMDLPFGPLVQLDYNGDRTPDDGFVITQGGMGSVAPVSVSTDGTTIMFTFKPEVCAGLKQGSGDSSFFFGMASKNPPAPVTAKLYDLAGAAKEVKTRAPIPNYGGECITSLTGPGDIPSPALINFDSADSGAPVAEFYHGNYGLAFDGNVLAFALTEAPGPHSAPNIAVSDNAAAPLGFTFDGKVSHVGFYAINTQSAGANGLAVAYDQTGSEICRASVQMPNLNANYFVGFSDPGVRIHRVVFSVMDSGQKPVAAQIDDLNFAPSTVAPIEFPRPKDPLGTGGPEVVTHGMDNTHVSLTVNLPEPSLWVEDGGDGNSYVRFGLSGVELNGSEDGYPDVPVIRRLIAYPDGATLSVSKPSIMVASTIKAKLFPSQPSALDTVPEPDPTKWQNPPFAYNADVYNSYNFFPANPVAVYPISSTIGKMRDLNLALVTIAAGRYNPLTQELFVYKSVDLDVTFTNGVGYFLNDQSLDPFEPDIDKYYGQVLNSPILSKYLDPMEPGKIKPICGTELYIVATPALLPAANTLAAWKTSKGISTSVVEYSSATTGIGNTKEQLKAFLKDKYDKCLIRPSYLLILGDAELIDTWPYSYTNSDLGYATMNGTGDYVPDLAYGRIPVDTLQQANTVVSKIIAYEKTPPTQLSFYTNFTFSSYFECCSNGTTTGGLGRDDRSFVETAEIARNALTAAGKSVQRIYTSNASTYGVTPAYYRNGAPLPAAIGPGSGFPWNGSTTDIVKAFNDGSGLMFHRDHGWPGGWWAPRFDIGSQSLLTNGNLTPVVYSVNCASGVWDNELPSSGLNASDVFWSEALLRMNGGAVGIIGDMRNSPTWANSALARGLFDATWTNTDSTYGDSAVHRRLGDILNYAKLYMLTQVYLPQTAGAVSMDDYMTNNELYHVIGDPTLELWTGYPYLRILPKNAVLKPITLTASGQNMAASGDAMVVDYPVEGATITLIQDGQPVGRGVISGGTVTIPLKKPVDFTRNLFASASLDDSPSVLLNQLPAYLPLMTR